MDKDLAGGPIGSVGSYDVKFSAGKLLVSAKVELPPGESAAISLSIDSDKVLDAIAAAVPGKLDNMLIGLIKSALNS